MARLVREQQHGRRPARYARSRSRPRRRLLFGRVERKRRARPATSATSRTGAPGRWACGGPPRACRSRETVPQSDRLHPAAPARDRDRTPTPPPPAHPESGGHDPSHHVTITPGPSSPSSTTTRATSGSPQESRYVRLRPGARWRRPVLGDRRRRCAPGSADRADAVHGTLGDPDPRRGTGALAAHSPAVRRPGCVCPVGVTGSRREESSSAESERTSRSPWGFFSPIAPD